MVIVANSEIYSRLQNLTIDYLEDLMGEHSNLKILTLLIIAVVDYLLT